MARRIKWGAYKKIQPDSLKTKVKMQEKLMRDFFFRNDLQYATLIFQDKSKNMSQTLLMYSPLASA